MIDRPFYLEKLKTRIWNDSIKIITGIRRCGKSFLLNSIFYEYLINSGVEEDHIIKFAFDSATDLAKIDEDLIELEKNKRKVSYKKFISYIETLISPKEKYYLLLDEVQRLEVFEYVLNGYLSMGNIDIYVTGSNSKFLSSDVITEFRGRGDEIHVMPLSFSEFHHYVGGDVLPRLDEYMTYGGLPRVILAQSIESKTKYLSDQMEKTFLKDVIERHDLKNTEGLNELVNIIASGISCLTNPTKLENRFKADKKANLSADTINKYIEYLKESYILDKVVRYDVKGKTYISTPYKLYFEDVGLRNAKLDFRQVEFSHLMENVIYNELKVRGYKIDVGTVETREGNTKKSLEVDFVVNNGSKRYYIQSALDISSEEKLIQETKSLDYIPDSFKKIVIVNYTFAPKTNEKGYIFLSLEDFLLNQDSLNW